MSDLVTKKELLFKLPEKRKNRACFFVFSFLSLAVMVLIFLFSNQTAGESSNLSGSFVEFLIEHIGGILAEKIIVLTVYVRKFAHFFLFAVLGVFVTSAAINLKSKNWVKLLSVALFGLFYGISDEVHQLFIKGRSCEITDVLIDFGGFVFGMCVALLVYRILCFFALKNKKI
ncbi:MAG: VanZ family protein [Clostridia bacterium]|nr:VanZ family protein [Clostridia bacterium]